MRKIRIWLGNGDFEKRQRAGPTPKASPHQQKQEMRLVIAMTAALIGRPLVRFCFA